MNIELNKSCEECSKHNSKSEIYKKRENTGEIPLTKNLEEEKQENPETLSAIKDNIEINIKTLYSGNKPDESDDAPISLITNKIKEEAINHINEKQEETLKKENNKTEDIKNDNKMNPNINQRIANGNSTIFQSIKSNKLEKDLLSKIVDDITFKKSILDNNNLIKSIKENENKNISLNLKIEMNLNLFNDKHSPSPNEYKIDTYAKEKTGINQTKKETEYYVNMPIYNNLNFKDNNRDIGKILNQICNDLIGEIRENRINESPQVSVKNEPNNNNYYNLGKAQYAFDYLKNPNNKIESQCLLEFLNFIDFNLKNTISQDNDFYKLYSKYEFLSNNFIDHQLFFKILDDKNSNIDKILQKHFNNNEDSNFQSKDLVINLGLNSENEAKADPEFKTEEILLNKNTNKNFFTDSKNSYNNFNKLDYYQISNENNKIKILNENKIRNCENFQNFRVKPYNGNYSINNTKTTINSEDIDIINDLQSVKTNNNHHISLKNSSLKIFKSSNVLNNFYSNNNSSNVTTGQQYQMRNSENDFKRDQNNLSINNFIDDSNVENNKMISLCNENKDFIISNNFTERILKNDNNFPDLTEILKFNIINDNLEQQFLLKQKKLKEEEGEDFNKNRNQINNTSKKYHFGDKRDILDDIELFESFKRKKFLIQKITNHEENLECPNSNNIIKSNMSNNKEMRKFKTDSIHKKIKVNILKFIKDYVVEFVPNKKIPNLSQEIVTNVNISYNKELLEKKIIDIYVEDFEKNNNEALVGIIDVMKNRNDFYEVMNMKLKDYVVEKYWKSDFHRSKLKRIYDFEPREYFLNYVNQDRDFINYFLSNRGNKKKGNKLNKNNDNMSSSTQEMQDNLN